MRQSIISTPPPSIADDSNIWKTSRREEPMSKGRRAASRFHGRGLNMRRLWEEERERSMALNRRTLLQWFGCAAAAPAVKLLPALPAAPPVVIGWDLSRGVDQSVYVLRQGAMTNFGTIPLAAQRAFEQPCLTPALLPVLNISRRNPGSPSNRVAQRGRKACQAGVAGGNRSSRVASASAARGICGEGGGDSTDGWSSPPPLDIDRTP